MGVNVAVSCHSCCLEVPQAKSLDQFSSNISVTSPDFLSFEVKGVKTVGTREG